MRVKLSFKDKTYKYQYSPTKRKMGALITVLSAQNVKFEGRCVVEYAPDYVNDFNFNDEAELKYKLWPCIEPELMEEFKERTL